MRLSLFIILCSIIALSSSAGAKAYYNRRAFPPPGYYYKGGYNAGPSIHKYRPPGFRVTRNPYIGTSSIQGGYYQPVAPGNHQGPPQPLQQSSSQQGLPQPHPVQQIIHPGAQQALPQGQLLHQVQHQSQHQSQHQIPQGQHQVLSQGQHQVVVQGQQHLVHQSQQQPLPHQVYQQSVHQPQQQVLNQGPQHVHPGPQGLLQQAQSPAAQQGYGQISHHRVPQSPHQGLSQGPYQGIAYNVPQGVTPALHPGPPQVLHLPQNIQQGPHHSLPQASPHSGQTYQVPKRHTAPPQQTPVFAKTQVIPQFTAAPFKNQPSHLNSIRNDYDEVASFTPATKSYYKPNDERSPIHTIPAPKLSPADKPADFDAKMLAAQQQHTTTPRFKTLDKQKAEQLTTDPVAILAQQTQSHFAADPGLQQVYSRIPPSNNPFTESSNGQLPLDAYIQNQLDDEIAQQESLFIQQQQAQQYQQLLMQQELAQQESAQQELAQQLQQEQQTYQIQQENLKQQVLQQQALEAQKQLSLQSQQSQTSDSLTAEELFNLMNGISTPVQKSTESVQDVLSKPQNQNEIISSATTSFQPNYQSFNYDEKAHQQTVGQNGLTSDVETKRTTSEGVGETDQQYQNYNYDEKTNLNEENISGIRDKKEKRYQKHAFSGNSAYTNLYSTLPKEIAETIPQIQYNHQQGGFSTLPVNYNHKENHRKLKPVNAVVTEMKKYSRKKNRLPNNGYSTIAEDLLQQHDLNNDLQQLTYSELPNQKIIEVLRQQVQRNVTPEDTTLTTEKNSLQKMRETAQKFYSPHLLQAVRNNSSKNDNVQIQQSIQIYESNYASKGDDNHIDLSGITTTPAVSSTTSSSTEPTVVTEINVIENTSKSDTESQESSLYEEIMLQDESKPLEDNYNSNSHSYFGQRIRPKRI